MQKECPEDVEYEKNALRSPLHEIVSKQPFNILHKPRAIQRTTSAGLTFCVCVWLAIS